MKKFQALTTKNQPKTKAVHPTRAATKKRKRPRRMSQRRASAKRRRKTSTKVNSNRSQLKRVHLSFLLLRLKRKVNNI